MSEKLGNFGTFVKQYEKARRVYPVEVFRYLKSFLKTKHPKILDLGCGTGISTRQLVKIGEVIGCDPDPKMLAAAKAHQKSGVKKYIVGSAEKLPFKNESFDVVTAFASFHWFDNQKAITEIRRVLKPNGIFLAVHKNGAIAWGNGYRSAIIKTIKQEIADFKKKSYYPEQVLKEGGFKILKKKSWPGKEIFNLKNALEYAQSVSIWGSVPVNLRQLALTGLEEYFIKLQKKQGKIVRHLRVKAIVAIK